MTVAPLTSYRRQLFAAVMVTALLTMTVTVAAREEQPVAPTPSVDAETFEPQSGQPGKDVVWVPTPDEMVAAMVEGTKIMPGDVHFDLGSGDGKIVIAAAKIGAQSTGVEYNPDMVALSQRNAARAGVGERARFIQGDIFETDFSQADVITLYLLPNLNLRLRPTLLQMKPGTRIASHQFSMGDWQPDQKITRRNRDALFWIVPARIGGHWEVSVAGVPQKIGLDLSQKYQQVQGAATWGERSAQLDSIQLQGDQVAFTVTDSNGSSHAFAGTASSDGKMTGMHTGADGQHAFTAIRTPGVARAGAKPAL